MKLMMKVTIPAAAGNRAANNGSMGDTISSILERMNAEAAYFLLENGCRAAYVCFEIEDAAQLPSVAEPWFLAFDAKVEIQPVMQVDDFAKASASIASAVETYGRRGDG